jgi:hypothetical protein
VNNDILWFCDTMPLKWKIWYMMTLYFNDPWMYNMIYDCFVAWWPLTPKYDFEFILLLIQKIAMIILWLVDPWMLNLIYEIRWPNTWKVWLIVINLDTLYANYDFFLCLNDLWMQNMIYDSFVARWTLECEILMLLEWEIWDMMALYPDDPW